MGIAWTPPIVPKGEDEMSSWWMTSAHEAVITDLVSGRYYRPVRVVAFNTSEGWSRDVSVDIPREVRRRCDLQRAELSEGLQDFILRFEGPDWRQLTLRLV